MLGSYWILINGRANPSHKAIVSNDKFWSKEFRGDGRLFI